MDALANPACPRCGAARPDDFRWCRKCGLDFKSPPKAIVPDGRDIIEPTRVSPAPPPQQVDFRPVNDRANMARMSRDAMDVRCLGAIGGLVGAFVAFLVVGWIGQMADSPAVLLLLIVAIPTGWWLGARTALGLIAR
jgi:hypothetical protein